MRSHWQRQNKNITVTYRGVQGVEIAYRLMDIKSNVSDLVEPGCSNPVYSIMKKGGI
jgi:hypothetical protein